MQFSVTSSVRQVMGETDGPLTLLISNSSGFDFFLCNLNTDRPDQDGWRIPAGAIVPPFRWAGALFIGTDQNQTNGQAVQLSITKSGVYR